MKSLIKLGIFAAVFAFAQPATAHDGWIEVSPALVQTNQVVTVWLLHGNHS